MRGSGLKVMVETPVQEGGGRQAGWHCGHRGLLLHQIPKVYTTIEDGYAN